MLELYLTFLKIGAFIIGGGYSMLPLLIRELEEKRGWTTEAELLDYFAVSQCTPGVIAVNTATFIGYKRKGVAGGIVATLGVITSPVIAITLIAALVSGAAQFPVVEHIFAGVRIALAALITGVVIKLIRSNVRDLFAIAVFAVAFALTAFAKLSPIFIVIGAVLAGFAKGRIKK